MLLRLLSGNSLTDALVGLVLSLPAIMLCLIIHEMSHGYMALALGDRTAKNAGRLSFTPAYHIDPVGFLCMLVFGFGWARPVPINISNFKNRRLGMALSAFAGPLSNFVLAFVCFLVYVPLAMASYSTGMTFLNVVAMFFLYTGQLSVGLGAFNLIPVHPLDGSRILDAVLPFDMQRKLNGFIARYQTIIMLAVIFIVWRGGLDLFIMWVSGGIQTLAGLVLSLFGFF